MSTHTPEFVIFGLQEAHTITQKRPVQLKHHICIYKRYLSILERDLLVLKRDLHIHTPQNTSSLDYARPVQSHLHLQKRHINTQKRPINTHKRPAHKHTPENVIIGFQETHPITQQKTAQLLHRICVNKRDLYIHKKDLLVLRRDLCILVTPVSGSILDHFPKTFPTTKFSRTDIFPDFISFFKGS